MGQLRHDGAAADAGELDGSQQQPGDAVLDDRGVDEYAKPEFLYEPLHDRQFHDGVVIHHQFLRELLQFLVVKFEFIFQFEFVEFERR